MIRIFTTTCLMLVLIVIILNVGERIGEEFKLEKIYSAPHLVGAFLIGVAACFLYRKRIDECYDKKDKEDR